MSDTESEVDTQPMSSAGAMLRAARRANGLDVTSLAAALKISVRKLEALEDDRYEELQGITFVRALAQAACRTLKIDPVPVLARLPQVHQQTLDSVSGGLNAPFRERTLRVDSVPILSGSRSAFLLAALLIGATMVLFFAPPGFWIGRLSMPAWLTSLSSKASAPTADPSAAPAAAATGEPTSAAASNQIPPSGSPPVVIGDASPEPAAEPATATAAAASGLPLVVKVSAASWVEVVDANGQSLISRIVNPGESVGLDGATPLRVKIGNAKDTELSFRGHAVDLLPQTRDNVARLELR